MVKISTKGRYAIRVMLDLAENNTGHYMPLMDIAQRQEISEKYLESIVSILSKNDFLEALRGKAADTVSGKARKSIRLEASCGLPKVR